MRAVVIDSAAGVTAAWTRVNSAAVLVVLAAHRPTGGSWSPATDLSAGATETYPGGLAVDAAGPVVGTFTAPAKGFAGSATSFVATATDTWSPVASYAWSFGDGTTGSGGNLSHTYAKQGSYTVTLTVTDAVGNATARTATTAVAAPVPKIFTFKLTESKIKALARHDDLETVVTDLLDQRISDKTKLKVKVKVNTKATLKLVFKSKHRHVIKAKTKYLRSCSRRGSSFWSSSRTVGGVSRTAVSRDRPDSAPSERRRCRRGGLALRT